MVSTIKDVANKYMHAVYAYDEALNMEAYLCTSIYSVKHSVTIEAADILAS